MNASAFISSSDQSERINKMKEYNMQLNELKKAVITSKVDISLIRRENEDSI